MVQKTDSNGMSTESNGLERSLVVYISISFIACKQASWLVCLHSSQLDCLQACDLIACTVHFGKNKHIQRTGSIVKNVF